jgi:hypothetical protein
MRAVKVDIRELEFNQGELMGEDTIGSFIFHMSEEQKRRFLKHVNQRNVKIQVYEVA